MLVISRYQRSDVHEISMKSLAIRGDFPYIAGMTKANELKKHLRPGEVYRSTTVLGFRTM